MIVKDMVIFYIEKFNIYNKNIGAGIFIDRIMVTEDEEASDDCRQFLFLCNKVDSYLKK